jgi:valyl-tRNA synthetase
MYAIYVPHITDYIYGEFFRKHEKVVSIHLLQWQIISDIDKSILLFGEELKNAIFSMRKYKSENNLSMRSEMDTLIVEHSPQFSDWFRQSEKDLKSCAKAKKVSFTQAGSPKN